MSEWKEYKLGELCESIDYGYTASAESEPVGPKFLRITDIVPQRISWQDVPYCTINEVEYKKNKLEKGDIVIARTGATTGYNYMFDDDVDTVFASYLIRYRINASKAYPKFINYTLKSSYWKSFVEGIIGGSAQPGANAKQFASFEILLPSLPEQKAIASVLSSLDDKIDLLHRQNKILEAMAETLFRQWFILEIAGQDDTSIGEYAENIKENIKVTDLKLYQNSIGLEHIPRKSITLTEWTTTENLGSNKYAFQKNDILFGKLRSYFHKVVFSPINGVASTDILIIRPKKPEYFPFCLFWLFTEDLVEFSDLGASGTRMPRTNWNILSNYIIPKPTENKIKEFNTIVKPCLDKITLNINQFHTLEKLRDTLLPKLMSGEVRVKL